MPVKKIYAVNIYIYIYICVCVWGGGGVCVSSVELYEDLTFYYIILLFAYNISNILP